MISALAAYVEKVLDHVTSSYVELREELTPPPRLLVREGRNGKWLEEQSGLRKGQSRRAAHVTVQLNPAHFLILTLPLPVGAKPYLNAVIASQIDRISPWPAERAIFGATLIQESNSSLSVRVAIAARDAITQRIKSLNLADARSVTLRVPTSDDDLPADIMIPFDSSQRDPLRSERRMIAGLAFGTMALVILTEAARIGYGNAIDLDLTTTRKEIAALKETIAGATAGRDLKTDPLARMINLKSTIVPQVEVIDALSQVLPDHTYLTALEIEPTKIHIEGISTEATDLPKAISGQSIFGDATFSAPTAKRRDNPGETFQLDIIIKAREENAP